MIHISHGRTGAFLGQASGLSLVAAAALEEGLLLVQCRRSSDQQLEEGRRLAESLAGSCSDVTVGTKKNFRPAAATFLGKGHVETVKQACAAAGAHRVVVNEQLSGVQQRNLEAAWGVPVMDRVGMIIEIFAHRARTKEARLQVELAQLDYGASRLVRVLDTASGQRRGFGLGGEVEVVSARERGRSGSGGGLGGAGGGGEAELQLQRHRLADKRRALHEQLEEVRRTRAVQRAGRARSGLPTIAMVGYTNAGKSLLLRVLTGAEVEVEDRLFATLDPTLRRVHLHSGRNAILSDTVGFVSGLPHQLVDAFRATLEEVVHADLLLHVLDISSPALGAQRAAVLRVLRELGLGESRLRCSLVEVLNKADLLDKKGTRKMPTVEDDQPEGEADASSEAAERAGPAGIAATGSHEETERWLETVRELVCSGDVVRHGSAAEPPLVLASALRGTGLVELLAVVSEKVAEISPLRIPRDTEATPAC